MLCPRLGYSLGIANELFRPRRCSPAALNHPDRNLLGVPTRRTIPTTTSPHPQRQHRPKAAATTAMVQNLEDREATAVAATAATIAMTTDSVTTDANDMKSDATMTEIGIPRAMAADTEVLHHRAMASKV